MIDFISHGLFLKPQPTFISLFRNLVTFSVLLDFTIIVAGCDCGIAACDLRVAPKSLHCNVEIAALRGVTVQYRSAVISESQCGDVAAILKSQWYDFGIAVV